MERIIKKETEIKVIKPRLGFIDNAEYELITKYKLFGITIKKKVKK